MEIRRFFVSPSCIDGDLITLTGDEFLHMTKVLRYKVGFFAVILANDGVERLCVVKSIGKDSAVLEQTSATVVDKKSARLTLFAGLLKNNKLDFTVQKAVELGVDRIVPFVSANCAESKFFVERANRIALEAAKQCGSAYLSEVGELIKFEDIANMIADFDKVYIAYEGEKKFSLKNVDKGAKNVALVVGPEGGFKPEEVEMLKMRGAVPVTLGRRILRAETAGIVACALLMDALGELDYD